jgi:DNA-binding protein HU-beta
LREEGNRFVRIPVLHARRRFVVHADSRERPVLADALWGEGTRLTKADLIDALAGEFELSKRQGGEIVDFVLDEIKTALQKGDKVQLIPFGSFTVRERKKREGRNPKTGEKLTIAARRVPAFSAGKSLRDAVGGAKKAGRKKAAAKK